MRAFLIILFSFVVIANAQVSSESNGVSFGVNYMAGKILIHTPRVFLPKGAYPEAIEISYKKQTTGRKEWHQRFGFPEIGLNISCAYYDFSYFGNAIGFYPSIQFRIITFKTGNWFFKTGGGLGIISRHWDKTSSADTFNNFIGSTVNNFTMFQSGVHVILAKHWSAQAGMHYYHVSNAATRQPNYGINAFGIFTGLNFHPQNTIRKFAIQELPNHKNPLNVNFFSSLGFVEGKGFDGPLYPIRTYSSSVTKMYRNKNRISVGLNAVFNTRTLAIIKNNYLFDNKFRQRTWQYSVFASHEFLFGNIGFPLTLGFYLNNPIAKKLMYQKLGLVYHFYHNDRNFIKDTHISLILNTHVSRAQYAEFGLGFML